MAWQKIHITCPFPALFVKNYVAVVPKSLPVSIAPVVPHVSQSDLRKGLEDKLETQKYNQAKVSCGPTTCNLKQPTLLLKAMINESISELS